MTSKVLCAVEPFPQVVVVSRAVSKDVPFAPPGCPAAVVLMQKARLQRWQANPVRFGNEQRKVLRTIFAGVRMFFWFYLLVASQVGLFMLWTVKWGYS